jgi:hypothetical protein
MNTKSRMLLSTTAVACVLFTSLSAAETQDSNQLHRSTSNELPFRESSPNIESKITSAVDPQDPDQMHRSSSDEMHFRVITPNAGPRVTNGIDVFITADFIYWTSRQDGLGYVRSGVADYDAAVALGNAVPGGTTTPCFNFSPGFKVGLGLNLGHDGWDTYLNYTWLHSSHSSNASSVETNSEGLIPLWEVATIGNTSSKDHFIVLNTFINLGQAYGRWALNFNNFDLDLGRNFYISQYLTLRPHAGLKGSWYTQNYDVKYSDFLEPDIADEVLGTRMHIKQSFWGIGVRTGLDTSWYLDKNWSIFGDTSLSALWGRFHTHRQDFVTPTNNQEVRVIDTGFNFHTVKPVLEFQLGLRYDYWFSDDEYHFGIQGAWEEQIWLNQNQFFDISQGYGHHGDLILQGFTLDIRFDF